MELTKLQRTVIDALEDVKAQDIKVFNTLGQSDLFDRVIVASGTSNRQTKALAWHVVEKVKAAGGRVVSVEGTDPGEWVLVDLGDIIVHVMQPAVRQYYGLEEVWGAKPVRVKLGAPDKAKVKKAAPKKAAAKKAPAKTSTAKRAARKAPAKRKTTTAKAARKRS
ncbi:MAG: ribosome silencing factor [Betaproteobacteria bacterium]